MQDDLPFIYLFFLSKIRCRWLVESKVFSVNFVTSRQRKHWICGIMTSVGNSFVIEDETAMGIWNPLSKTNAAGSKRQPLKELIGIALILLGFNKPLRQMILQLSSQSPKFHRNCNL